MKKTIEKIDLREDWKLSIESEIDTLMEEIDYWSDEMGLSKEAILKLEKIINLRKDHIMDKIDEFEITTEMVFDKGNDGLFESCLEEIDSYNESASETAIELMINIIDDRKAGYWIPSTSLAEDMKIEAFMAELSENPYQLKLIA